MKLPVVSKLWRLPSMICAWNGRPQHLETNVSGLLRGNGCCIFIVIDCLRKYGPIGVSGQLVASWNRGQRYDTGDDVLRFRAKPIWLSRDVASSLAVATRGRERHLRGPASHHKPPTFCSSVSLHRLQRDRLLPFPPSDALVITYGLSTEIIR